MATAQSKLDILIEAKQQGQGLQQVTREAAGLESTLGRVGAGLIAAFSVAAVARIAQTAFELARTGAEAERLGTAFNTLSTQAGQNANAMLDAMREASQGTISNADLMLGANRAMLLGVADSAEEMSQLLEVASARGKAMGITTAQAFGDIVTGIGRMSPMILDNLGIVVDQAAANEVYAASLNKTAESLTDAERKQALLNAVISSSTSLVRENEAAGRDSAANFERMDAAISNAKDALGAMFAPSMAIIANDIANAAEAASQAMENMADERPGDWLGLIELTEQMKMVDTNAKIVAEDFTAVGMTAEQARAGIAAAGGAAVTTGSQLRAMGLDAMAAMESFNVAMAQSQAIAQSIESAAASSGALFAGKQGGDAGLSRQQQVTSELTAQRQLWEDQGYTQKQINDVLLPGYVSQLREADNSLFRAANNTTKLSDEAQAAKAAFEDLKGTVAGVLSGALDSGTGVDPDAVLESLGLPREDAINESARRLADIAQNGLKGQDWLGDFANDVPDIWEMIRTAQNPQEEAAYLLRDFQDGLLTAAIDKDKAKEIVKRQILGDQNMAALAQEIAEELANEMGVPMQEALAAAQGALGGGGTTAVGGDAAQGFTDGANINLDETNAGGTFVDKFIGQMRASYSLLKTAGADGGKQWGDGFMATVGENVPPALISLLTNLVTPGVMAQFAQQGTLTGAQP